MDRRLLIMDTMNLIRVLQAGYNKRDMAKCARDVNRCAMPGIHDVRANTLMERVNNIANKPFIGRRFFIDGITEPGIMVCQFLARKTLVAGILFGAHHLSHDHRNASDRKADIVGIQRIAYTANESLY